MSTRQKSLFAMIALLNCFAIFADAMTIAPMDPPENLAKTLVGDGINITNVSYQGSNISAVIQFSSYHLMYAL